MIKPIRFRMKLLKILNEFTTQVTVIDDDYDNSITEVVNTLYEHITHSTQDIYNCTRDAVVVSR